MKLSGDTIFNATLIAAPPSTKNQEKSHDLETHQTKKGNEWHFGMKLHVGTDKDAVRHRIARTVPALALALLDN